MVVGDRPQNGPMQTASGTRGARSYDIGGIDNNIAIDKLINATTEMHLPARKEDVFISQGSINLRDQIRDDSSITSQLMYEAAKCRIFFIQVTWSNYISLWTYAAYAIWTDSSMCVPGSTGYASDSAVTETQGPPKGSSNMSNASSAYNITAMTATRNQFIVDFGGQEVDKLVRNKAAGPAGSKAGNKCTRTCNGLECRYIPSCGGSRCVQPCGNFRASCGSGRCSPTKQLGPGTGAFNRPTTNISGFCSVGCQSSPSFLPTYKNEPPPSANGRHGKGAEEGLGRLINKGLDGTWE